MNTKAITAFQTMLVTAIVFSAALVVVYAPQASAQRANTTDEKKAAPAEQQKKEQKDTAKAVTYNYVAQPGDTYSEMARKAVQTYGKKYNVKLSLGQILFAETNLTQQAGSPYLEVGQNVVVQEADAKNWIQKAQKLDASTVALWNAYVPGVDFNTNDVGEK